MIIVNCTIYFFGNALDSIQSLFDIFGIVLSFRYILQLVGNTLFFGSHGLYIFNYYHFNRNYRNTFRKLFLPKRVYLRTYEDGTTTKTSGLTLPQSRSQRA